MKQRGSAILIAVFLMAAVGSIAFGVGRLFMFESNIAGLHENSIVSYYAAESGLEEGLLRFRYDKNIEVPNNGLGFTSSLVNRNNLDDNSNAAQQNVAIPYKPSDGSKHIYTMQMSYLASEYGTSLPTDLADSSYIRKQEFQIPKDESIKIDISGVSPDPGGNGDINLYTRTDTASCDSGYDQFSAFIEAKVTGTSFGARQERKVSLLGKGPSAHSYDLAPTILMVGQIRIRQYNTLLDRVRRSGAYQSFTPGNVELTLRTVGCGVWIGIDPIGVGDQISQPYTTIKSTGYYGGVTRTLEAKIDRQAGTLYDLFDYVIYDRN